MTMHRYKHLNEDKTGNSVYEVHYTIPELFEMVNSCNYGVQRFLCELVEDRKKSEFYTKNPSTTVETEFTDFTDRLEQLINEGMF